METTTTTKAPFIDWKNIAFSSVLENISLRGTHKFEMHMYYNHLTHLIIVGDTKEEVEQKANDYFDLIRNTYGANINPEKMQDVVVALEDSVKEMKYLLAELQERAKGSYRATSTLVNAEKALNNIKLME